MRDETLQELAKMLAVPPGTVTLEELVAAVEEAEASEMSEGAQFLWVLVRLSPEYDLSLRDLIAMTVDHHQRRNEREAR